MSSKAMRSPPSRTRARKNRMAASSGKFRQRKKSRISDGVTSPVLLRFNMPSASRIVLYLVRSLSLMMLASSFTSRSNTGSAMGMAKARGAGWFAGPRIPSKSAINSAKSSSPSPRSSSRENNLSAVASGHPKSRNQQRISEREILPLPSKSRERKASRTCRNLKCDFSSMSCINCRSSRSNAMRLNSSSAPAECCSGVAAVLFEELLMDVACRLPRLRWLVGETCWRIAWTPGKSRWRAMMPTNRLYSTTPTASSSKRPKKRSAVSSDNPKTWKNLRTSTPVTRPSLRVSTYLKTSRTWANFCSALDLMCLNSSENSSSKACSDKETVGVGVRVDAPQLSPLRHEPGRTRGRDGGGMAPWMYGVMNWTNSFKSTTPVRAGSKCSRHRSATASGTS
mmetsp:Transcript_127506/g.366797  ORF Transcript_127506/g.366797 Transcript_127506/m.366797 type:complete len:396 (+) Transcript_127506:170-1357(+)